MIPLLLLFAALALGGASGSRVHSADVGEPAAAHSSPQTAKRPTQPIKVIHSVLDGHEWNVRLFGNRRGESCWSIQQLNTDSREQDALIERKMWNCDTDVPPRLWLQAAEVPFKKTGHQRWMLLFLLRHDVKAIKALTGRSLRPGKGTWTGSSAHSLSERRATRAGLRRNIGYATIGVPEPGCVRRVVVVGQSPRQANKVSPLFRCRKPSMFGVRFFAR